MSFVASILKRAPCEFVRPCANFRPSIWGDTFLQYDSESQEVNDTIKQQAQTHKDEVKQMYLSLSKNTSQILNFIDSIQRLGISRHFKHEIDETLEQIYNDFTKNKLTIEESGDLHYLALLFRLLRQKGYHISSDIFKKFMNKEGKFNETIAQDVQGMRSFYEAAQLRVHNEAILEEALDFIHSIETDQSIRQTLHKEVPRIGTRRYISLYEEDPFHNKVLLTFAKLDFNMLQKLHQKEVGSINKWYKEGDFATKVPYARERVVEAYLWSLAISYEPNKCSMARIITGKLTVCISLLDDTYDAFGTIEELELLTEAIKSWDISAIESLPECMKVVFNAILNLWDEIEFVTKEVGNSSLLLQHIKQAFFKLAQSYMVEAKWCHEGYIPTYDEYKLNGIVSSTIPLQILAFLGLGGVATKEVLDWISNDPKIVKSVSLLGRLMDDLASNKFEQQRVHVASAVECCMKQYDISQEEARKLIHKENEEFWKDINEAYLKSDEIVTLPVLDIILNMARIIEFTYVNFEDKYTNTELLKDYIAALLLDPTII